MLIIPVEVKIVTISFFHSSHLHPMEPRNNTQISGFLLQGLSKESKLLPLVCGLFLATYLITVWEPTHHLDCQLELPHPHPHDFFLSNLSFVDLCFISTTIPKMLWNIQTQSKGITYEAASPRCIFTYCLQDWMTFS